MDGKKRIDCVGDFPACFRVNSECGCEQEGRSFGGIGITYCGPSSLMLRLASQCPISTHSSRDLPSTIPATKPPAKASLRS